MVRFPYLPNPPYTDGHDPHDSGEAADASHYFSRHTMQQANSYQDIGWMRLAAQAAIALVLMGIILLPITGMFGAIALLCGAGLAIVTAYVAGAKLLGAASRD